MRSARRTVLVLLAAALGIALAAAITWGTSQLVRQRIGLASEPLTAGRQLLPNITSSTSSTAPSKKPQAPAATRTVTTTVTESAPATAPAPVPTQTSTATSPGGVPPSSTQPREETGGGESSSQTGAAKRSEGDAGRHRDD